MSLFTVNMVRTRNTMRHNAYFYSGHMSFFGCLP